MPGDSFLRGKYSLAPTRSSFLALSSQLFLVLLQPEERRDSLSLLLRKISPLANANVKRAHPLTCLPPHLTDVSRFLFISFHLLIFLSLTPFCTLFFLLLHSLFSFRLLPFLFFPTRFCLSRLCTFVRLPFFLVLLRKTSSSISSHNRCYSRLYRLTRHPLFRVQRTVHLAAS